MTLHTKIMTSTLRRPIFSGSGSRFAVALPEKRVTPRPVGALPHRLAQQVSPRQVQVHQTTGGEQPVGILVQPAIAGLHETEYPLEYMKRMLHPSPHPRLGTVPRPIPGRQWTIPAALVVGKILRLRRTGPDRLALTTVGRIPPEPRLLPVQQIRQQLAIVHIGRRGGHSVDHPVLAVHPDVRLYAEVPLVALPGLVHLGSRCLSRFLVELGALIMVASTMVPVLTFSPFSCKY